MVESVHSASRAPAGTWRCTNCGYRLLTTAECKMPPCPECMNGKWKAERSGDTAEDLHLSGS